MTDDKMPWPIVRLRSTDDMLVAEYCKVPTEDLRAGWEGAKAILKWFDDPYMCNIPQSENFKSAVENLRKFVGEK